MKPVESIVSGRWPMVSSNIKDLQVEMSDFFTTPHQSSAQYLSELYISLLLPGSCWATLNACPAMLVANVNPISQLNTIHSLSDISLWMAGCCTSPSVLGGKKTKHNNQWVEQTNTMSAHSWRAKCCLLPFGSPWKQPNTQPALSSAPTRHTAVHVWWQVGHSVFLCCKYTYYTDTNMASLSFIINIHVWLGMAVTAWWYG